MNWPAIVAAALVAIAVDTIVQVERDAALDAAPAGARATWRQRRQWRRERLRLNPSLRWR